MKERKTKAPGLDAVPQGGSRGGKGTAGALVFELGLENELN